MNTHTNDNSSAAEIDKCITWQYDKATNLVAFIGMLGDFFAQSTESLWDSWKAKVNDIDTADDFGLSVWGKILNCRRPIININGDDVNLGTEKYRAILKARAQLLASHGTVPNYKAYIETAFDGHFIVQDGNDMGITFAATDNATAEEVALADQFPDIAFLFPCGVRSSSVTDPASIGFKGQQTNDPDDTPVECFGLANFHSVKSEYEVTLDYYDGDKHVVETQTVAHGGNVVLPQSYSKTGHDFVEWSAPLTNITYDQTIRAIYTPQMIEVTIQYCRRNREDVSIVQTVPYGGSVIPPEDDFVPDGYSFVRWNSDVSSITAPVTIKAVYAPNPVEFTFESPVTFVISTGSWNRFEYSVNYGEWIVTPQQSPGSNGLSVYNVMSIKIRAHTHVTDFKSRSYTSGGISHPDNVSFTPWPETSQEQEDFKNMKYTISGNIMSLCSKEHELMESGISFWNGYESLSSERIFSNSFIEQTGHSHGIIKIKLPQKVLAERCYEGLFSNIAEEADIELVADVLKEKCYRGMFAYSALKTPIKLPAKVLADSCYKEMFIGCENIKMFTTEPGTEWSIPGDAVVATNWNNNMFKNTGGDFKGNPEKGTTYYSR